MIFEILGSKFETSIESEKLNKILYVKICEFMNENEYFHEEHFLEFLEEDYNFDLADEQAKPQAIITLAQLEDWVEQSALDSEQEDQTEDDPLLDPDLEDEDFEDNEDLEEDDD